MSDVDATRPPILRWMTARRAGLLLLLLALALVAPQLRSGAELVRARHALALGPDLEPGQDWRPPALPADFKRESIPPDPYFVDVAQRLGLATMGDDWQRTLAISAHLLGSGRKLTGGAIQRDLRTTHRRIVDDGQGYCGDFVRVFTAIANAVGMTVRPWAFSFDGFGGHGHIWIEVWNRQHERWQLADVFQNYRYELADGQVLSAAGLRTALLADDPALRLLPLHAAAPPGWIVEAKARDYLRRGLAEWYAPWGNNVMSIDRAPAMRLVSHTSRALEGLVTVASGLQPRMRMLATPENLQQRESMRALRSRLAWAAVAVLAGTSMLVVSFVSSRRKRPQVARGSGPRAAAGIAGPADKPGHAAAVRRDSPRLLVLSSLFPSRVQPGAGLFVRERMFRVGARLPLAVVAPAPWFPLQGLLRRFKPGFRPGAPAHELQQGHDVWFPRYLSFPGVLKQLDGLLMARGAWSRVRRIADERGIDIIDAHFGYPDGFAAVELGRRLGCPVTITMRGTESRHAKDAQLRPLLVRALEGATRVFAVSESLRQVALSLGIAPEKVRVVGNGVDIDRFRIIDRAEARRTLAQASPAAPMLGPDARVLVTVGGLVERKGFHRVIEQLPALLKRHPTLHYLVVGGPSTEGDMSAELRSLVRSLGLDERVHFLGLVAPDELHRVLSAADLFVLSTRNEGWANVFLEAMACGLPVVTTDVGGNREVVCADHLGLVVPFGDGAALADAISRALDMRWDGARIRAYAESNTWSRRVEDLLAEFATLAPARRASKGMGERA